MSVRIGEQTFEAEYMNTPEEKTKGMMGRKDLNGCMVFNMGKGHHSFWMKNCLVPLDIIYVLNNRISHIHSNCPPADPHQTTHEILHPETLNRRSADQERPSAWTQQIPSILGCRENRPQLKIRP